MSSERRETTAEPQFMPISFISDHINFKDDCPKQVIDLISYVVEQADPAEIIGDIESLLDKLRDSTLDLDSSAALYIELIDNPATAHFSNPELYRLRDLIKDLAEDKLLRQVQGPFIEDAMSFVEQKLGFSISNPILIVRQKRGYSLKGFSASTQKSGNTKFHLLKLGVDASKPNILEYTRLSDEDELDLLCTIIHELGHVILNDMFNLFPLPSISSEPHRSSSLFDIIHEGLAQRLVEMFIEEKISEFQDNPEKLLFYGEYLDKLSDNSENTIKRYVEYGQRLDSYVLGEHVFSMIDGELTPFIEKIVKYGAEYWISIKENSEEYISFVQDPIETLKYLKK